MCRVCLRATTYQSEIMPNAVEQEMEIKVSPAAVISPHIYCLYYTIYKSKIGIFLYTFYSFFWRIW